MSRETTPQAPKTLSVPHAGEQYFALSRGASYAAVLPENHIRAYL
jgi:hypothetical protein